MQLLRNPTCRTKRYSGNSPKLVVQRSPVVHWVVIILSNERPPRSGDIRVAAPGQYSHLGQLEFSSSDSAICFPNLKKKMQFVKHLLQIHTHSCGSVCSNKMPKNVSLGAHCIKRPQYPEQDG